MKTLYRLSAILFLSLTLTGCVSYSLVDPAKPAAINSSITVMPQIKWNQYAGDHKIWTANGQSLDTIHFYTDIKSGQPLYRIAGVSKDDIAVFDAKMLPNDIQDLVVSTLGKQGYQNVRPGNLSPCPFGAATGFCFDLSLFTGDGLEMKGLVAARKRDTVLDVIAFLAPSEYYFGEYSPTVSKVFASIQAK